MRFTRWDQVATTEFTNEVLLLLSELHCSHIPAEGRSEQASAIINLVRDRDVKGLCLYELLPTGDVFEYSLLRQVLAFFQKRADLDIGVDTEEVARQKFLQTELKCQETNELFRKYSRGGFYFHPRVESILFVAQRKISTILGELPSLETLKLRFGPGATTQVKKKDASVRRKLAQMFCVSEDAIRLLPDLLAEMPSWSQVPDDDSRTVTHSVAVTSGRVGFVPKNAKTDRTIAVEPMLNGMLQLGIGDYIADRLRVHGVDLTDQSLNQRMAREGSLTGRIATLDMSSASDLVACGLVESLLPYDWWDLMRSARTREVSSDHGTMAFQKFSSMGNGFTFALESLIFYALAKACAESHGHRNDVNVYGDDIVVPVDAVPLLIEVLTACGFEVNRAKSYWEGSFRESCGKDYFSGIDVRPKYIKDALSGHTCFSLHNHYVRTQQPEPAELILQFIDESLRLWGPDGFGDGHLLGDNPLVPFKRELGWGGYTFETYTYKSVKRLYNLGADYVYPAYAVYVAGDDMKLVPSRKQLHPVLSRAGLSQHFRCLLGGNGVGSIRPDAAQAVYKRNRRKQICLQDTLPGVDGYKRVKIYTLG